MAIDDHIRDEKLQYNINREAVLSNELRKYEYITVEEILPSNQTQIKKTRLNLLILLQEKLLKNE